MKKALTALFAIAAVAAASAFAADKTDVPAPAVDNGARPPLEMGRGPLPPFPPQLPPPQTGAVFGHGSDRYAGRNH